MLRRITRHLRIAALAALAAAAVQTAAAGDFFAGYDAYLRGDHEAARSEWEPLAKAGDIDAQFNLGVLHETGLGTPRDPEKAARWYQQAAPRLALARFALVRLQRAGALDTDLFEDSIGLLEALARDGIAAAQHELAIAYDRGLGVTRNLATAAVWYERAAEQGLVDAQYHIGLFYDEGLGTTQDRERARAWYLRAADAGHAHAMNNLGYLHEKGLVGPPDQTEAVRWYRRAAEAGLAIAQNNLAVCYYLGRGVKRDFERAAYWYRAAAEQGDAVSQNGLALLYANGLGVERDLVRAAAWFAVAAAGGGDVSEASAARRDRVEEQLTAQERADAETLSNDIAARIGLPGAGASSPTRTAVPRSADNLGDLAVQVQRLLKALGYYHAKVDGMVGPATLGAVRRAIQENNFSHPIEITPELAEFLEKIRNSRRYAGAGPD